MTRQEGVDVAGRGKDDGGRGAGAPRGNASPLRPVRQSRAFGETEEDPEDWASGDDVSLPSDAGEGDLSFGSGPTQPPPRVRPALRPAPSARRRDDLRPAHARPARGLSPAARTAATRPPRHDARPVRRQGTVGTVRMVLLLVACAVAGSWLGLSLQAMVTRTFGFESEAPRVVASPPAAAQGLSF